jgi:hypothetical protein
LTRSDAPEDVETKKGYIRAGQKQYLAALHFEGLNNIHFVELKQEVHNGWIVHGDRYYTQDN